MKGFIWLAVALSALTLIMAGCPFFPTTDLPNGNEPYIVSVSITDEGGNPISSAHIGDFIYVSMMAGDEDRDMEYVFVKRYLDTTLYYRDEIDLPSIADIEGDFSFNLEVGGPAGEWIIDFWVFDSMENYSNLCTIYFTIY